MKNTNNSLQIWRAADWKSLELRKGTSFEHSYPRHSHDEFFLSAITGGSGNFFYGNQNHIAYPGTLVLIAPGEVHSHSSDSHGRSFRSLHMTREFLTELESEFLQGASSLSRFQSDVISDPATVRTFLKLHRVFEKPASRLRRDTAMLGFLRKFIRRAGSRIQDQNEYGRERAAVARALQFLRGNYDQEISLKCLSTLANLSPYYFHREFVRAIGMPPHAYQIQLRITQAKLMLKKNSIAAVATRTGFVDQSHFSRHFKRLMGITPAKYARESKNIQYADSQVS